MMGKQIYVSEREFESLKMAISIASFRLDDSANDRLIRFIRRYEKAKEQRNFKQGNNIKEK